MFYKNWYFFYMKWMSLRQFGHSTTLNVSDNPTELVLHCCFFFFFVFSPLSTSFLNHSLLFLPPFFITLFFLGFFKFFFPLFYYWKYIVHLSNNHYNLKKISFFSFKSEQMLRRQKRSNIGIDLLRSLGFLRAKALRWDSDEMQKFRSKN